MEYLKISRSELDLIISEEIEGLKERIINRIISKVDIDSQDSNQYKEAKTPLPQNEKYEKTLKLIHEGKSQSEIARILGVSIQTVRRYVTWLIINGYVSDEQTSSLTKKEIEVANLIYKDSKTLGEVAKEMNCSVENIKLINDNISSKGHVSNPFIKIIYPGFLNDLDYKKIGFPKNRKKLAEQISLRIKQGEIIECFIYLTHPVKKVVGLVRLTSEMQEISSEPRWPYQFSYEFIIRPKYGVGLMDVGIGKRCRPGDTVISIDNKTAQNLVEILNKQVDLTEEEREKIVSKCK